MNATAGQQRHTTAILAIILVSYFMILLDNSIVFTALPKIHRAMHFSTTGLAWVQDAYTLVFGGLLLLGARAGDLLGRRRVFVLGLAAFALASLLVGLAPTGSWLITARGLQGTGAAMIVLAPSYLPETPRRRGRFDLLGAVSATFGVGAIVYGIINAADATWASPRTIAALVAGAALPSSSSSRSTSRACSASAPSPLGWRSSR